jgi:hypothetical protein
MLTKLRILSLVITVAALGLLVPAAGVEAAVEVISFQATAQGDTIRVSWQTAYEFNNVGFNLYRSDSPDGPRSRINADLIDSLVLRTGEGAVYAFVDGAVQPGVTYYYWLQTEEMVTGNTEFGPATARLQVLFRRVQPEPLRQRPWFAPAAAPLVRAGR